MQTDTVSPDHKEALKNVRVFTGREDYFGIPSKIFFNIVAFSVGLGVILKSLWVGVLFLTLLGYPAYHIHRRDPQALFVWYRAWRRPHALWVAGVFEKREIVILSKEEV